MVPCQEDEKGFGGHVKSLRNLITLLLHIDRRELQSKDCSRLPVMYVDVNVP